MIRTAIVKDTAKCSGAGTEKRVIVVARILIAMVTSPALELLVLPGAQGRKEKAHSAGVMRIAWAIVSFYVVGTAAKAINASTLVTARKVYAARSDALCAHKKPASEHIIISV